MIIAISQNTPYHTAASPHLQYQVQPCSNCSRVCDQLCTLVDCNLQTRFKNIHTDRDARRIIRKNAGWELSITQRELFLEHQTVLWIVARNLHGGAYR